MSGFEEEAVRLIKADKNKFRWILLLGLGGLMLLFLLSLMVGLSKGTFFSPQEVAQNLLTFVRISFAKLRHDGAYDSMVALANSLPGYTESKLRFLSSILVIVAGAVLGVSGAVYQSAFRNPMAGPTLLGVAGAINLGNMILVLQYSTLAVYLTQTRYLYCYGLAMAILGLVIVLTKVIGGRIDVVDMLLVGMVMNLLLGSVTDYYQFEMTADQLLTFQQLSMGGFLSAQTTPLSFAILAVAVLVGVLPIHLFRLSFNAVSFSEDEAYAMGIRTRLMRLMGIIGATVLVTAALIHFGTVGAIALVIPHLCRYMFGSNFKTIYITSALFGAAYLLLCQILSSLTNISVIGHLPVGSIVNLVTTPIFILILVKQRRGWE